MNVFTCFSVEKWSLFEHEVSGYNDCVDWFAKIWDIGLHVFQLGCITGH